MQDHYIVRNHQGLPKLRICHPMAIESLQDQKRLPGLQEPIHPCSLLDCALEILELSSFCLLLMMDKNKRNIGNCKGDSTMIPPSSIHGRLAAQDWNALEKMEGDLSNQILGWTQRVARNTEPFVKCVFFFASVVAAI